MPAEQSWQNTQQVDILIKFFDILIKLHLEKWIRSTDSYIYIYT